MQIENEQKGNFTISDQPHTGEDAVTSIIWLQKRSGSPLYLLKSHRDYRQSPLDSVPATFTLYMLKHDAENQFHLEKIASETSKKAYCSSDIAAQHELNIPLPAGIEDVPCVK